MLDEHEKHPHPLVADISEADLAHSYAYFLDQSQAQHFHEHMAQARKRLGHYIEDLIVYWLTHIMGHPCKSSIQINDVGRSLGEFDMLFKMNNTWHWWELCFKFYCLHINEEQAQEWIGPNSKDSCARKYKHLFKKQLALADHPCAQAHLRSLNVEKQQRAAWFKGQLFVHPRHKNVQTLAPMSSTLHRNWYLFQNELADIPHAGSSSRFLIVAKCEWIAPVMREPRSTDIRSLQQTTQEIKNQAVQQEHMLIELKPDPDGWWVEINRGFILPVAWPQKEK